MNKLLTSAAVSAVLMAGVATADEVKIGMLQGFTGPTESLVGPMAAGGEMAIQEVNDSGLFLGGTTISVVRGDSTCIDAAAATAAAERLVTSDGVAAINGATCSGEISLSKKVMITREGFAPSSKGFDSRIC